MKRILRKGRRRRISLAEVRREQGRDGFVTFTPWGVGRDWCCSACVGSAVRTAELNRSRGTGVELGPTQGVRTGEAAKPNFALRVAVPTRRKRTGAARRGRRRGRPLAATKASAFL